MPTCLTFARRIGAVASVLVLLGGCATPRIEPWSMSEGLNAPESAYLDRDSGTLFVSQVGLRPGGTPMDKDGNGVISKLTRDGKVLAANWVTGLNSPKGLRSHGDTRLLRHFKQGTADLAYLPESRTLIVSQMLENRVQAYDLSADLKQ